MEIMRWRSWLKMNRKGTLLGSGIALFVATMVVVVTLIIFAFVSGAVKIFSGVSEGLDVSTAEESGLIEAKNYVSGSSYKISKVEFLSRKGTFLESALREVDYEK